jgi:hypothetical protein
MSKDQIVFEEKDEQYGFIQLSNVVLTSTILTPIEKVIYAILRRYASMEKGAMPSIPTIILEANISKSTYQRAVNKFIRSDKNPNPEIPLITSIKRKNKSNLFKIHKLTDPLIQKLHPAVSMSEAEKEQYHETYKKKKKKSGVQNETIQKNKGKSQIEPHQVGFILNPLEGSNRTPSNIELNNIEQQQQEHQKNVVVVRDEFEKTFEKKITKKQAEDLIKLAIENDKDVLDAIKETATHFKQKNQQPDSAVGSVRYSITDGWDIEVKPAKVQPSHPAHVEFDDAYFANLFGGEQ